MSSIPTVKEAIGQKDGLARLQAACYRKAFEYKDHPKKRRIYEQSLCAFTMPAINLLVKVRRDSFG